VVEDQPVQPGLSALVKASQLVRSMNSMDEGGRDNPADTLFLETLHDECIELIALLSYAGVATSELILPAVVTATYKTSHSLWATTAITNNLGNALDTRRWMVFLALTRRIPGWAQLHYHSLAQVVELRRDAALLDDPSQDLGRHLQKSRHGSGSRTAAIMGIVDDEFTDANQAGDSLIAARRAPSFARVKLIWKQRHRPVAMCTDSGGLVVAFFQSSPRLPAFARGAAAAADTGLRFPQIGSMQSPSCISPFTLPPWRQPSHVVWQRG